MSQTHRKGGNTRQFLPYTILVGRGPCRAGALHHGAKYTNLPRETKKLEGDPREYTQHLWPLLYPSASHRKTPVYPPTQPETHRKDCSGQAVQPCLNQAMFKKDIAVGTCLTNGGYYNQVRVLYTLTQTVPCPQRILVIGCSESKGLGSKLLYK